MSSGLYSFGTSLHHHTHSSSDMLSSGSDGGDLAFLSDAFHFFNNSTDHLVSHQNQNQNQSVLFDEPALPSSSSSADPFSTCFFSFSPPSTHLQSLSINPQGNLESEFASFSGFDGASEVVKSEECQIGSVEFDYAYNNSSNNQQFLPHSYSGAENNVSKYMQRSFSSNSFEGKKPGNNILFQNNLCDNNTLSSNNSNSNNNNNNVESPNFHMSSPEQGGQMRRVCSTGDLQNMNGSLLEEGNFKVGRYSAEERKERISKYRAKRSQRNFNKTIKYACRKTLADNRPRIRGRFARNDDTCDIPKAPSSIRDEDDDVDFWIEGLQLHEEQEEVALSGAEHYINGYGYGATQLTQYYRF